VSNVGSRSNGRNEVPFRRERRWPALGDQVCRRQICHVFFQGRRWHTSHFPRAGRHAAPCSQDSVPCLKIAAGGSFLGVGRSKRRNGAPRSGVRVFPRHAGVFAAPCQHLIHGSPGHHPPPAAFGRSAGFEPVAGSRCIEARLFSQTDCRAGTKSCIRRRQGRVRRRTRGTDWPRAKVASFPYKAYATAHPRAKT
jgi:hypothetical protein